MVEKSREGGLPRVGMLAGRAGRRWRDRRRRPEYVDL